MEEGKIKHEETANNLADQQALVKELLEGSQSL